MQIKIILSFVSCGSFRRIWGGWGAQVGTWLPMEWVRGSLLSPSEPRESRWLRRSPGEAEKWLHFLAAFGWMEGLPSSFLFSQCAFPSLHATPFQWTSPWLPPLIIIKGKMHQCSYFRLSVSFLNALELPFLLLCFLWLSFYSTNKAQFRKDN